MKRLLGSTAALSIALAPIQPWPLMAQTLTETGSVVAADGSVLCEPTAEALCDPANFVEQAAAIAAAMATAAEAEAKAAADAAALEAEAKAAADAAALEAEAKAAADAAALEAEAKAAADAAALEAEAKAAADAAALEAEAKAAADAAALEAEAKAAADAAALEAEAKAAADAAALEAEAKAAADAAALEAEAKAAADAAALEAEAKAAADAAALEAEAKAAADAAALEAEAKAAADAAALEAEAKAAADAAAVEAEAKEEAPAEGVTEEAKEDAPAEVVTEEAPVETLVEEVKTEEAVAAEAEALETAKEEIVVSSDGVIVDPAAGLATAEVEVDPNAVPVDAPVVTETEVETLTDLLAAPETVEPVALEAAASLTDAPTDAAPLPVAEAPPSPDAVASVVEVLTEADTRTSDQEFTAAPVEVAPGKKNRLSDLEKAGLAALAAITIGAIIKDAKNKDAAADRQVVSNTGDRVVVLNPDGSYTVYKDDDAVLRRPGSTVRTETFKDGSTRTIVERVDGSQVVTIRDATGRVLRRSSYDKLGREIVLIDDFLEETPVVVSKLPKPKPNRVTISAKDENAALQAKLAAREAAKAGRTFSLRQVREIAQVRALAATIDAGNVTFDSGSAAIKASEADALADLGSLMQDLLDVNPGEVFLIEGHTDATGKAAMNLSLSDRRAESVALALTEYFDIPPENMVVQGYGEGELLIDTQADERRNRRVAARVITPLLTASN